MYTWLWKGPFTPLFLRLLKSNMQMSSKITILGYIATYYALAFGLPLTFLNYLLVGWYNGYLDKFYIESWKIFVALIVVFSGLGNVCLAVLRYRLGQRTLISALWENFKWMPMFAIFFGGMSFHLFLALSAHMFSINMEWYVHHFLFFFYHGWSSADWLFYLGVLRQKKLKLVISSRKFPRFSRASSGCTYSVFLVLAVWST